MLLLVNIGMQLSFAGILSNIGQQSPVTDEDVEERAPARNDASRPRRASIEGYSDA